MSDTRYDIAIARRTRDFRQDLADLVSGEYSLEDIARRREISVNAVRNRVHRFEKSAGRRIKWPWRQPGNKGRKPSKVLSTSTEQSETQAA